ncbi:MAG: hypothetical protein KDD53_12140, partial [Bdellovibrionales bacterium]|nr:hypothetical protein [Bdellovibrionales bacterium]
MLQELPRERFRALQAESNQELFPLDPFTEHDPRSLGAQAIESAKRSTYDEMLSLSDQFEGSSNVLVKTAAILAMECHFNHFRGGPGDIHYSAHLLETAKRVDLHFSTQSIPGIYERITTQFGENLDPKAIAIAIALLHDSLEDFHENFRNQPGT